MAGSQEQIALKWMWHTVFTKCTAERQNEMVCEWYAIAVVKCAHSR